MTKNQFIYDDNTHQLIEAARRNDLEKVRQLIDVSDPKADDSLALFWASKNGNVELVELLMPVSEVSAYYNEALRIAAQNNHQDVIRLLIPHCDPNAPKSLISPLYEAVNRGFIDEARELFARHNIDIEEQTFRMRLQSNWQDVVPKTRALHEQYILEQHMPNKKPFKTKSKI